ncbi:hypothetical protein C8R46DRAFT_649532 [Mycena filopes]|nr:hypothetical protein C8R46DRAFT_649532 [Mycena filopes]
MPPVPFPAHLAAAIQSDEFKRDLERFTETASKMMPDVVIASRKKGETGTLDQRIEERSQLAITGVKLAALGERGLLVPGSASSRTPPKPNGMMNCVRMVDKIIRRDYGIPEKKPDFSLLAYLLKRIRHLLRVHYNFEVGKRRHPDLEFCDWETMLEVGLILHQVGLCLQLDPPRLRAVMASGGRELEEILLDDELDVGEFRTAAVIIEERVAADVESEDTDRMAAGDIEEEAEQDLAAHVVSWFYGDITVAFILNEHPGSDVDEKRWAGKALKRLVHWSTSPTFRSALGDPLTDAMRPIYWSPPLLVKFSQAGGLAALFGDWVNSTCRDMCEDVLTALPEAAWDHQTPASLLAITREMQFKVSQSSSEITNQPIFVNACFNIFKRYGLQPFSRAARRESHHDSVVFYYLTHRIKRDHSQPEMQTRAAWARLLTQFVELPRAMERRYAWGNLTISGKWDCLEFFGCDAEGCPAQAALEALRDRRVRGVREAEVERQLEEWGAKAKACAACGEKAYCSAPCQRAHWPVHKPKCLQKRKIAALTTATKF